MRGAEVELAKVLYPETLASSQWLEHRRRSSTHRRTQRAIHGRLKPRCKASRHN